MPSELAKPIERYKLPLRLVRQEYGGYTYEEYIYDADDTLITPKAIVSAINAGAARQGSDPDLLRQALVDILTMHDTVTPDGVRDGDLATEAVLRVKSRIIKHAEPAKPVLSEASAGEQPYCMACCCRTTLSGSIIYDDSRYCHDCAKERGYRPVLSEAAVDRLIRICGIIEIQRREISPVISELTAYKEAHYGDGK